MYKCFTQGIDSVTSSSVSANAVFTSVFVLSCCIDCVHGISDEHLHSVHYMYNVIYVQFYSFVYLGKN